jgi:hypothetical protein
MLLRRYCFAALGCAVVATSLTPAGAQSMTRLLSLSPAGGKVGTSVNVTVTGQDLDELRELRFSAAGITSEMAVSNTFKVKIGPEVPAGVYDARVIGKNGASNPRAFAVGALDEIVIEKTATSLELAKEISLNSTVNARADVNAVHYFRVRAKKGERVLVRCDARGIDSKLDPALSVLDEHGREMDRNRRGGILDFTAPADGAFVIKVHDVVYRGGTELWYRLAIGTFPHVDFVSPSAVAPGKNKVTVFGRNLPGGKGCKDVLADGKALEQLEIEIDVPEDAAKRSVTGASLSPFQAAAELFAFRLNPATEPVLLSIAASPPILEHEPNDTKAQKISLPCDIGGQFAANRDRDWFTFDGRKGEAFWVEVVSHRLGLPTDPLVIVQHLSGDSASDVLELNDSEANIGGNEFDTRHRDLAGKLEIKENGTYRILVRNLFGSAQVDAQLAYHLSIRKPAPDFRLVAVPQSPTPPKKDAKDVPLTPVVLRRNETIPVKVIALRRDGFAGDIELTTDNLPDGLSGTPARIENGKNSTLLFLTATDDANATNANFIVRGTASISGTNVSRVAESATMVWATPDPANEAAIARMAANSTLSLMDDALPVRVRGASNVIETVANKTVKVQFLIQRDESFRGPLKLKPFGFAAVDSVPELEVDAKATNLVLQIDLREKKVPAGTHVFALQGSATGKPSGDKGKSVKEKTVSFYSAPVTLKVNPASIAQTNPPAK